MTKGNKLPEDVLAIAQGPSHAHIATVLPDGSPHSVPVWVGVEDGKLAVLTSPGSRKARNIAKDPRVAVSMTEPSNRHSMAQVRGRVCERVEGDDAWKIIDRMSQKYIGGPYPVRDDRVVFLIEPESASAQTF